MAKNYTSVDHLIAPRVSKEAEPVSVSGEQSTIHEVVEYEASRDVERFVETRPETIRLTDDQKNLGAQNLPPTKFSTEKPMVPLTDQKIEEGLKLTEESSFRWLAERCLYLLKKAHVVFKVVKGKLVRS
jgi:hypothetical protein